MTKRRLMRFGKTLECGHSEARPRAARPGGPSWGSPATPESRDTNSRNQELSPGSWVPGLARQGHPGTTAEFFRTQLISRMRRVVLAIAIVTVATALLPFPVRATNEVFASIGTGELSGIYYPVGNAICQIVNQDLRTDASAARRKRRPDQSIM